MKWKGRRKSSNIEDQRGQTFQSGRSRGINPMLLTPIIRLLFSKKGIVIIGILLVISYITNVNPVDFISQLFFGTPTNTIQTTNSTRNIEDENETVLFCQTILGSTEDVWNQRIQNYREPTLVLFSNSIQSACGFASSATGPFYCPGDEKLYIDLSFFKDMENQLQAPGDFAQAYVIAHEVGHHIQKLLGITDRMNGLRQSMSKKEYNTYSVRLELQADFLAGVWAHHSQQMTNWMEEGDLEEALNAANAIGDDRLQKNATGRVVPDSFTHGTSKQRMRWFTLGFETGDLTKGDTFSANPL